MIVENFKNGGSARLLYDFFWTWKKQCPLVEQLLSRCKIDDDMFVCFYPYAIGHGLKTII